MCDSPRSCGRVSVPEKLWEQIDNFLGVQRGVLEALNGLVEIVTVKELKPVLAVNGSLLRL